ncbi:MAG TPA: tetratricopeptide repeat protein [Methylocella sp.]|nr:tetratricopeptide repeat protein [Methylocella sp.]
MRRQRLDDLFARLQKAENSADAAHIASTIQQIYLQSFSDTGDLLMQRAVDALHGGQFELALSLLDKLVLLDPQWAEAWNQRATVRYLTGDYDGSMADINQVLKSEPRHFGALTGMGMILHETGFDKDALKIFNRALSIYPLEPDIRKLANQLTLEVEGRGI